MGDLLLKIDTLGDRICKSARAYLAAARKAEIKRRKRNARRRAQYRARKRTGV